MNEQLLTWMTYEKLMLNHLTKSLKSLHVTVSSYSFSFIIKIESFYNVAVWLHLVTTYTLCVSSGLNWQSVSDCYIHVPYNVIELFHMSRVMRKRDYCLCENKGADQRRCFRYTDSTIPLLLKIGISMF